MKIETEGKLGFSPALGFWEKHSAAMDELYELHEPSGSPDDEVIDPALLAIWNNPNHREQLEQVFRVAEYDKDLLLAAVAVELEAAFGRKRSPLNCRKRRFNDSWGRCFYIRPNQGEFKKGPLQLTAYLGAGDMSEQAIFISLWSQGGKAVKRTLTACLDEVEDRSGFVEEEWSSGSVVLSHIRLSHHLHADSEALDMDAVLERARDDLAKQTNDALSRMAKALKL